jgi:hypothetical protein
MGRKYTLPPDLFLTTKHCCQCQLSIGDRHYRDVASFAPVVSRFIPASRLSKTVNKNRIIVTRIIKYPSVN